jgi:insertion element IS1 protein InsB
VAFYPVKKRKLWVWKAFHRDDRQLIDWELGDRSAETLERLLKRLSQWDVKVYCTDNWPVYGPELEKYCPKAHHVVTKAETVAIEGNNSDTRHWLGRFRRRSKIVSKSLEMVDLSLGLFAKFRVNGTVDLLRNWYLSLLA